MTTRLETTDTQSSVAAPEGGTMKAVVQEGTGSAEVLHLREVGELMLPDARDFIRVHGAGGRVRTFAVQIAKTLGAHVTAVTGPKNVDLVRTLGPDEIIDYTKEDVTQRAQRYDVVFDVAATRPIGTMRGLLTPNGIFVQCGASKSGWLAVFGRILALVV